MATIGGSIALTCLAYGVVAGFAFFLYLCLFTHVRDSVKDAKWRWRCYFLIAVTFVLLGRYVGISVVLGVLPMLAVLHFLPKPKEGKDPFAAIIGCSLVFALLSGGAMFFLNAPALSKTPENTEAAKQVASAAPAFDPDKYFVSDAIDPNMEFDEPVEVTVGDITFKLPIPKGFSYVATTATSAQDMLYHFNLSDSNGLRMVFSLAKTESFPSRGLGGLKIAKVTLGETVRNSPNVYITSLKEKIQANGIMISKHIGPELIQCTKKTMIAFCSFETDKKRILSILDGVAILGEMNKSISVLLIHGSPEVNKRFGVTWFAKMTEINS